MGAKHGTREFPRVSTNGFYLLGTQFPFTDTLSADGRLRKAGKETAEEFFFSSTHGYHLFAFRIPYCCIPVLGSTLGAA